MDEYILRLGRYWVDLENKKIEYLGVCPNCNLSNIIRNFEGFSVLKLRKDGDMIELLDSPVFGGLVFSKIPFNGIYLKADKVIQNKAIMRYLKTKEKYLTNRIVF